MGTRGGRSTFLSAVGDVTDPRTWSGSPYHLMQVAVPAGLVDEGLSLSITTRGYRTARAAWNLANVALGRVHGGYRYSLPGLRQLWWGQHRRLRGDHLMSCFQLVPPWIVDDVSIMKTFYVDQTLEHMFSGYERPHERLARAALERERQGYSSAAAILAHSRWAADSVSRSCPAASPKVHVVVPGANLDVQAYSAWEGAQGGRTPGRPGAAGRDEPLRFVFVGSDWRRKGLDRLLRAHAHAQRRGSKAILRTIGPSRQSLPPELRDVPRVEWVGRIDKTRDPSAFIRAVAECDVGCLLSRAEAGGISLREFHALGLAVLGTTVGGSPEHALPDAAVLLRPETDDSAVADVMLRLEQDADWREELRRASWAGHRDCLWQASVAKMQAIVADL